MPNVGLALRLAAHGARAPRTAPHTTRAGLRVPGSNGPSGPRRRKQSRLCAKEAWQKPIPYLLLGHESKLVVLQLIPCSAELRAPYLQAHAGGKCGFPTTLLGRRTFLLAHEQGKWGKTRTPVGGLPLRQVPRRGRLRAAPLPHSHNALVGTPCFAPLQEGQVGPGAPPYHREPTSVQKIAPKRRWACAVFWAHCHLFAWATRCLITGPAQRPAIAAHGPSPAVNACTRLQFDENRFLKLRGDEKRKIENAPFRHRAMYCAMATCLMCRWAQAMLYAERHRKHGAAHLQPRSRCNVLWEKGVGEGGGGGGGRHRGARALPREGTPFRAPVR
jgi:hypothetical protein